MLGLPKATEMSKQLPKKAIYAKFQMNTAAKEKIDADISRITIVNEITPNKVNIPAGDEVKSFFVLLVTLKRKEFEEKTIATLSKLIPQNILFVLECSNESKLAIYHTKLMQTDWMPTTEQKVELNGLNLDKVWENLIRSLECGVWTAPKAVKNRFLSPTRSTNTPPMISLRSCAAPLASHRESVPQQLWSRLFELLWVHSGFVRSS